MGTLKAVWDNVKNPGLPRIRRSLAQLPLCFFALVYLLVSIAAEPEWRPAFVGLGLCYLAAFLAIGSEWFWGRWYASGLGWSGMMVGIFALVTIGPIPQLIVYGVLHAIVVFALKGKQVSALYEGRAGWRERYGLDDHGVSRMGKTVTRAAASLPALVIWALGPKEPEQGYGCFFDPVFKGATWYTILVPVLVAGGLFLLIRMRSAGIFVLAAGALVGVLATTIGSSPFVFSLMDQPLGLEMIDIRPMGLLGLGFLATSLLPFAMPVARYLRDRRV